MGINILGLSEVKWPGCRSMKLEEAVIYNSESNNPSHRAGVTVLVHKCVSGAVMEHAIERE